MDISEEGLFGMDGRTLAELTIQAQHNLFETLEKVAKGQGCTPEECRRVESGVLVIAMRRLYTEFGDEWLEQLIRSVLTRPAVGSASSSTPSGPQ